MRSLHLLVLAGAALSHAAAPRPLRIFSGMIARSAPASATAMMAGIVVRLTPVTRLQHSVRTSMCRSDNLVPFATSSKRVSQ